MAKNPVMQPAPSHDGISEIRWSILLFLKQHSTSAIADIANHFQISYEAGRQHINQLEKQGWVARATEHRGKARAGRPTRRYALTQAGDHLFPKHYDSLSIEVIDALAKLGPRALKQVLTTLTDNRVRAWAPALEGKSLEQRVRALKGVYFEGDPFMAVEIKGGAVRLIERNCPFLNVASQRPALCSVTISTLQRLLGVRVVREKRFQNGDGCCVFRIATRAPIDAKRFRFAFEEKRVRKGS